MKKKSNGQPYALKCLWKNVILDHNLFEAMKLYYKELKIENNFMIQCQESFQTDMRMFFVQEFIQGGDFSMLMRC